MPAKRKIKADFQYTEGDTLPEIGGKITDENGAFDLTDYTVQMAINRDGHYQNNLIKTALVNDPLTGEFVFEWADTDLVCGDGQEAVIRLVNNSTTKVLTYNKFTIDVAKKIEV